MIHPISQHVWFGDKPSVAESVARGEGGAKAVINVAHSIRKPYWGDLGSLPWDVWYLRLALPDAHAADRQYLEALEMFVICCATAGKTPILCHCRVGGHRGPTAGIFAAWVLGHRKRVALYAAIEQVLRFRPGYNKPHTRRVYRDSVLAYCLENSEGYQ